MKQTQQDNENCFANEVNDSSFGILNFQQLLFEMNSKKDYVCKEPILKLNY